MLCYKSMQKYFLEKTIDVLRILEKNNVSNLNQYAFIWGIAQLTNKQTNKQTNEQTKICFHINQNSNLPK